MQEIYKKSILMIEIIVSLLAFSLMVLGSWMSTPTIDPGGFMGNHFRYLLGYYLWTFSITGMAIGYLLDFPKKKYFLFSAVAVPIIFWGVEFVLSEEKEILLGLFSTAYPIFLIEAVCIGLVLVLPLFDKFKERLSPPVLKISRLALAIMLAIWLALPGVALYMHFFKRIEV